MTKILNKKNHEDDSYLYLLIRCVPSVLISRGDDDENSVEFVPKRN